MCTCLLFPRQGLEDFTNIIRTRTRPLRFSGQLVSGAAYAGLASAYVKAINEGAVPQLVTAWQGVARAECGKAAEAGLAAYVAAFKENVDGDDQDLYQEHQVGALHVPCCLCSDQTVCMDRSCL